VWTDERRLADQQLARIRQGGCKNLSARCGKNLLIFSAGDLQ
jgi:hypothetical protein